MSYHSTARNHSMVYTGEEFLQFLLLNFINEGENFSSEKAETDSRKTLRREWLTKVRKNSEKFRRNKKRVKERKDKILKDIFEGMKERKMIREEKKWWKDQSNLPCCISCPFLWSFPACASCSALTPSILLTVKVTKALQLQKAQII